MAEPIPKSEEVLNEEFYDACAWVRDVDLTGLPPALRVSVTVVRPMQIATIDPETGEQTPLERVADVPYEIQRFIAEDTLLHVHGPYVCVDLDMDSLAEKRPRP